MVEAFAGCWWLLSWVGILRALVGFLLVLFFTFFVVLVVCMLLFVAGIHYAA